MESVLVSTELPYVKIKRQSALDSPYNIDFWKELKKRWMVAGVLAVVLLAVISPRVGAPGGPLRTEYLTYIPSSIIYFGAGARLAAGCGPRAPPAALLATAALHAHVAAPALCVCVLAMFGDALHGPVISGALLSSCGGGCAWLSLALSRSSAAALVAGACLLASLIATPLSVMLLCGRTSLPPASCVLGALAGAGLPLCAGAALRPGGLDRTRGWLEGAAALALLYADCCGRLVDAEGTLYVSDLLATLFVEVFWVGASACVCVCYGRWWGPRGARLIALCAVPKALDGGAGWGAAACAAPALSRLPGAVAAPAQALLLAAWLDHQHDREHDRDRDFDEWDEEY